MDEYVPFGTRLYALMFLLLLVSRGMDMLSTVSAINGYARVDRDLPGTLRSQYVEYLLEHL